MPVVGAAGGREEAAGDCAGPAVPAHDLYIYIHITNMFISVYNLYLCMYNEYVYIHRYVCVCICVMALAQLSPLTI